MKVAPITRRDMILVAAGTVASSSLQAADSPKIRIAQIGTKHAHAAGKMESIRKLSDLFEVVGIAETDDERRESVRESSAYAGLTWMPEEEILASDVAAIAVETSVPQLVPTALRCIRAGKHVHLDKPAGTNLPDCRELHEAADERGLTIQMGYMLRYNPAFELLFDIVEKGWLGRITEVNAAMGKRASDTLRAELAGYPGGGMFELACHLIDAVVTVLGKPESVTAFNRRSYPEKDEFVDNQIAVLEYLTAVATIRCNHLDPFGGPRRFFEVVGESGFFRINPLEPPQVELAFDQPRGDFKKGIQSVDLPRATGRYDDEFRDLARIIRDETSLAWDSAHDIAVQETVLLASGMVVE